MEEQLQELSGSVDSVVYLNENNGYCVLILDNGYEPITVVGELGNVDEGEELRLMGKYIEHPKFGTQFKAVLCERKLPSDISSIRKYLASGVIKGIGPVLAKKIVDKFGEETLYIIENTPQKLVEVDGITHKKSEQIAEEFLRVSGVKSLMLMLSKYNVSASFGARAWRRWGIDSETVINKNPYALCGYGIELPFLKADSIAAQIGLPYDNPNRIKAGIRNVLKENASAGHTCLPKDKLCQISMNYLRIPEELFNEAISEELDEQNLCSFSKKQREFIALKDLFTAEDYISRRICLMGELTYDSKINFDDVIDLVEEEFEIKYESLQRKAINTALSRGFLVLTGGPGTGKTTTLNAIISLYAQQGLNVMITAPTGRAAKRISDLTGYEAKTIHRLLEVSYTVDDVPRFNKNENDPLDCDVLIIDEMSMVDVLIFESLLRALKISCKLIMVGDSDQLPSVGAGNVLKDIIDSGVVPTIELKEIFRQAQKSAIVVNAHRIVKGEQINFKVKNSDMFFFQRLEFDELQELIVDLVANRLPNAYGYTAKDNIQVLSPTRKGPSGTVELNNQLQLRLNPPDRKKAEIKTFGTVFRVGDKVMQIKNNYDITWSKEKEQGAGIFNGDIGTIIEIKKAIGMLKIDFDGRICNYPSTALEQLELAYAATVHKSQGSEFDVVILAVLGGYDKLYYRNLLYTAVTRAKKMLIIVGSTQRVKYMIDNNRRTLRYTLLKNMLLIDRSKELDVDDEI